MTQAAGSRGGGRRQLGNGLLHALFVEVCCEQRAGRLALRLHCCICLFPVCKLQVRPGFVCFVGNKVLLFTMGMLRSS